MQKRHKLNLALAALSGQLLSRLLTRRSSSCPSRNRVHVTLNGQRRWRPSPVLQEWKTASQLLEDCNGAKPRPMQFGPGGKQTDSRRRRPHLWEDLVSANGVQRHPDLRPVPVRSSLIWLLG